jgi:hypothetical protein
MLYVQFLSWWWAEEPPETCRTSCRNKRIMKLCILLVILENTEWVRTGVIMCLIKGVFFLWVLWNKDIMSITLTYFKCTLVQALRLCTGRTAHRGIRGIALPFHDHGTRRGWGVSVTPRPLLTPGKDPVPIVQEAGWAPRPVLDGRGKSRPPPGLDPRTVQPVAGRYTAWATGPTYIIIQFN